MTLQEKIKMEMQEALKAKEEVRLSVLRNILSEITNELVKTGRKPTEQVGDEEVLRVIKRLAKQRNESIVQFESGGRDDLADKERNELLVLETYLPEMLPRDTIEREVEEKIKELGISDKSGMGQLMGAVMKSLGGQADGTMVREVVEEKLS